MSHQSRKEIVTEIFRFIEERKPKDGLKYFAKNCVQHNPYVKGGMEELFDSMVVAQREMSGPQYPDPELKVRYLVEGDHFVVAYTQLLSSKSDPSKGGLRQAHLFRFDGDKIVEYWDLTQVILPDMPNPANAF